MISEKHQQYIIKSHHYPLNGGICLNLDIVEDLQVPDIETHLRIMIHGIFQDLEIGKTDQHLEDGGFQQLETLGIFQLLEIGGIHQP